MKLKFLLFFSFAITQALAQGFDPLRTSPEAQVIDGSKQQGNLGTYPSNDQRTNVLSQYYKSQKGAQDTLSDLKSLSDLGETHLSSDGQTAESYPKQKADLIKSRNLFEDFFGAVQDVFDPTKVSLFHGEAEASYKKVRNEVLEMVQDKKDAINKMAKLIPTLNLTEGERKETIAALNRATAELDLTGKAFANESPSDYKKALDTGIYQIQQFKQTSGNLSETWKKTVDRVSDKLEEDINRSNLFLDKLRSFAEGTPADHEKYKRDIDQLRFEMASQRALSNGKYLKISADLATKNLNELADEMGVTLSTLKSLLMNDDSFDQALRNTPMGQYVNKQIAKALGNLCELKNKCEDPNLSPDKIFDEMFYFLDQSPRGNYLYQKKPFEKIDEKGERKYFNSSPQ